jgi:hypothetical protein
MIYATPLGGASKPATNTNTIAGRNRRRFAPRLV